MPSSKLFVFSKASLVLVSVLIVVHVSGVLSSEQKGPSGPSDRSPPSLRNRFPINFQKSRDSTSNKKPGSVKILEALSSRVRNVLKKNPSHVNSASVVGVSSSADGRNSIERRKVESELADDAYNDSDEESSATDELLEGQENGIPGFYSNIGNLPKPVYHPLSNNYASYGWGKPKPTMISYKPMGSSPEPPIIFPPITTRPTPVGPPGPGPTPVEPPRPTEGPVGPPSPPPVGSTLVPIIGQGQGGGVGGIGGVGGGGSDGDDDDDDDDGDSPPAPPTPDIFPPSPPEIESSVGRSLALKSSSPRTRVSNIAAVAPRTLSATGSTSSGRSNRVRTRLRDKIRESLEEDDTPEPSLGPDVITDFVFSDIRCFKTRSKEYFGATIHMKRGYHTPYVRDRPHDPLTSNECRMEAVPGSKDTFHMTVTDLKGCGVEKCEDYMCLTMVFPRVPTLALADDEVTTIKCLPQKSTMSDTRTISFAGDSLDSRRSSSTVEGGGQDFAAEVGVFRQNPGGGNALFVKRVNSGGVVQLGEPLQLRSIVRGGDGWKHSRLSDVKVWRMRDAVPAANLDTLDPNDASEVITLVDTQGCRNNEYQVIAERHPLKDPRNELVNHFTFKAFLFRGQRANEPLILTAKVHACQEDLDCIPKDCEENSRKRRSPVEIRNASAIIHDWDSQLSLRVVGLKDHSSSLTEEDLSSEYSGGGRGLSDAPMTCAEKMAASGFGGGLIALLLGSLSLALYTFVIKGRKKRNPDMPNPFLENGNHHLSPRMHTTPPQRSPGEFIQLERRNNMGNKPLPLPPTTQQSEKDKISSSEISNVAKILQKIVDRDSHETQSPQDQQTEYECIDETSSNSSSGDNDVPGSKKSDGVYIVYCCKDKKGSKRPKSAPPSLREKRASRKSLKKITGKAYADPVSDSQTEVSPEDSEFYSSDTSTDNAQGKCTSFVGRRTVRGVKSRSHHHSSSQHNNDSNSKQHKMVKGIRRRLSSLYKERQHVKNHGSFPSRQKGNSERQLRSTIGSRGHPRTRTGIAESLYSSPSFTQIPSDPDSAYYGSEINNDDVLLEMRQLASQHSKRSYPQVPNHQGHVDTNNNNSLVANVKMQLRNGQGHTDSSFGLPQAPLSPRLGPGQTKAAHFVTRNESSTQILIVPETHV